MSVDPDFSPPGRAQKSRSENPAPGSLTLLPPRTVTLILLIVNVFVGVGLVISGVVVQDSLPLVPPATVTCDGQQMSITDSCETTSYLNGKPSGTVYRSYYQMQAIDSTAGPSTTGWPTWGILGGVGWILVALVLLALWFRRLSVYRYAAKAGWLA